MDPRTWSPWLTVTSLLLTAHLTAAGAALVAVFAASAFFGETPSRDDYLAGAAAAVTGVGLVLLHAVALAVVGRPAWGLLLLPVLAGLGFLVVTRTDAASTAPVDGMAAVGVWEAVGSALALGVPALWPVALIVVGVVAARRARASPARSSQSRVSRR